MPCAPWAASPCSSACLCGSLGGWLAGGSTAGNRAVAEAYSSQALLELTINAARSAGYFWASRGLNAVMDDSDQEAAFVTATRAINGGLNGLADRRERWALAKEVMCVQ